MVTIGRLRAPPAGNPLSDPRALARTCGERGEGVIPPFMKRVFDMDDRARLPWRFFGAAHSVLARR